MKFNYQARTKTGEIREGTVEATSRDAALTLLQGYGLFLTSLEATASSPFYSKKVSLFDKASQKDLVLFSRQLSIMFKSEVPLIEALKTLSNQCKKQDFKEKITKISEKIEGGTPLSQALSSYPKLFDDFYINIVKSGESSGKLSDSLNYLADHLEREYYLTARIKGAMIYPMIIFFMTLGIMFMMAFFVIPQLTTILQETGQELPFLTKLVIGFTNFLRSWMGIGTILGIVVAFLVLMKQSKKGKGKEKIDAYLLKTPIISSLLKLIYLSRFAENLSTLISGGLPIAKSLEISGSVVGNTLYKRAIEKATEGVKKGEKISTILERYPDLFPSMFTTMIFIGERTGTLDNTLLNLVNFYGEEIERGIDSMLKVLEPLMIIVMGGGVGFMIAAILLPMYQTMVSI